MLGCWVEFSQRVNRRPSRFFVPLDRFTLFLSLFHQAPSGAGSRKVGGAPSWQPGLFIYIFTSMLFLVVDPTVPGTVTESGEAHIIKDGNLNTGTLQYSSTIINTAQIPRLRTIFQIVSKYDTE